MSEIHMEASAEPESWLFSGPAEEPQGTYVILESSLAGERQVELEAGG